MQYEPKLEFMQWFKRHIASLPHHLFLIFSVQSSLKMPHQHFSPCSVLLFFCPVTVTEPVCVQFKIKGCSYLWAEGVYTRSARTLSSSEYLLSGPVPWLLSHDGIWHGFCASVLLAEHVPTVDGASLWSNFHIPVGVFFFSQFQNITRAGLYIVTWTSWYSDCLDTLWCQV